MDVEWAALPGGRGKRIVFEQIGDRRCTLVLDIDIPANDSVLVKSDGGDALVFAAPPISSVIGPAQSEFRRLSRIDSDSACASSPSASASRIAAGASAARLASSHRTSDVRFIKSSTPSPEAKRALRAVGKT